MGFIFYHDSASPSASDSPWKQRAPLATPRIYDGTQKKTKKKKIRFLERYGEDIATRSSQLSQLFVIFPFPHTHTVCFAGGNLVGDLVGNLVTRLVVWLVGALMPVI